MKKMISFSTKGFHREYVPAFVLQIDDEAMLEQANDVELYYKDYFPPQHNLQFYDPDYKGGANGISLREAQQNVLCFGVSEECYIERDNNRDQFEKDPNWQLAK